MCKIVLGFRPRTHMALDKVTEHLNAGYHYVIDTECKHENYSAFGHDDNDNAKMTKRKKTAQKQQASTSMY